MTELTLYCEHVNRNHVHCNKYASLSVDDLDKSVRELIEESDWGVVDGEIRCDEHVKD